MGAGGKEALVPGARAIIAALVPVSGQEALAVADGRLARAEEMILQVEGTIVATLIQKRGANRSRYPGGARAMRRAAPIDPATVLGSGKVQELAALVKEKNATVIVFANPLRRGQKRNLERITGVPVLSAIPER